MYNLHIPQLLEKSSDFNPKKFQETLKNINLKLHFEYALVSLVEIMDIEHIKKVHIYGLKDNNQFSIGMFGRSDIEADVNEVELSKKLGRYCTLYFENSFKDLTPYKQKQVVNKVKKQCKQVNNSLKGLNLNWWEIPLNAYATQMFNTKYQSGFMLNHENKQQFINEFLPNEWGEHRALIQEQQYLNTVIEKKEDNESSSNLKKQSKL
jgi:hypothetical protein